MYISAAYFYFMIGKYQLCLDYIFKLNMYVEIPSDTNVMIALCYIMLNQPGKALPIMYAADKSMVLHYSMGLLLAYNRLGWPLKVIDFGE